MEAIAERSPLPILRSTLPRPAQVATNQLPVNGSLRGRYNARSGVIDLSALNLTTPHTHLDATGTLGSTSAALKLAVNVTSLTEFQPLLAAMGNAPLPVELGGIGKLQRHAQRPTAQPSDCRTSAGLELHLLYTAGSEAA